MLDDIRDGDNQYELDKLSEEREREYEHALDKLNEKISLNLQRLEDMVSVQRNLELSVEKTMLAFGVPLSDSWYRKALERAFIENKADDFDITSIGNAQEGDIVFLGRYKKSAELLDKWAEHTEFMEENGPVKGFKEKSGAYIGNRIPWIVLDRRDNVVMVLSLYGLGCAKYTNTEDNSWEKSTIREYLNGKFCQDWFTPKERKMISTVNIETSASYDKENTSLAVTEDRVFLLSLAEAKKYFKNDKERICIPMTDTHDPEVGGYAWWLRDPGFRNNYAASVYSTGEIDERGNGASNKQLLIRPAMWIKVD